MNPREILMRLTVEDGKIVVNPRTSEEKKGLLKFATNRVLVDVVKAKLVEGRVGPFGKDSSSST